jgi:hypothetical protein
VKNVSSSSLTFDGWSLHSHLRLLSEGVVTFLQPETCCSKTLEILFCLPDDETIYFADV